MYDTLLCIFNLGLFKLQKEKGWNVLFRCKISEICICSVLLFLSLSLSLSLSRWWHLFNNIPCQHTVLNRVIVTQCSPRLHSESLAHLFELLFFVPFKSGSFIYIHLISIFWEIIADSLTFLLFARANISNRCVCVYHRKRIFLNEMQVCIQFQEEYWKWDFCKCHFRFKHTVDLITVQIEHFNRIWIFTYFHLVCYIYIYKLMIREMQTLHVSIFSEQHHSWNLKKKPE